METRNKTDLEKEAIAYFQDRLSKFCPADKNRPNGFETAMFEAGYMLALTRLSETLALIATPPRADGIYNRDRRACEQLAREALKEIDDYFGTYRTSFILGKGGKSDER